MNTSCNQVDTGDAVDKVLRRLRAHELRQLPFIDAYGLQTHWSLPRRGGYSGGELAGEAAALAYLKELRAGPEGNGGTLQHVVLNMAASLAACDSDAELDSVRGQIVGFFTTIEEHIQPLTRRTRRLGFLDAIPWAQLQHDVDAGLTLPSDEAYSAERTRRDRSAAARRGWQRRRHESRLRAAPAGRQGGAS